MLGVARCGVQVTPRCAFSVLACVLWVGCASEPGRDDDAVDAGQVPPCDLCNVYTYTCVKPGVESTTLSIEEMVDGGCRGTHLGSVELRCDPPQYCATGQPCVEVVYTAGGTINFGGGAYCYPHAKRVE